MAGSVNKVILVGNVGRDPEVQRFAQGGQAVKFSLATSENWQDKASGERKEKTEWHNVVIYNENIGRVAEQYVRKGSKIYVEGQLQSREYTDKDGNQRKITEVVLQRFRGEMTLLDSRGGGERMVEDGGMGGGGERRPAPARRGEPAAMGRGDLDDEVPF